MSEGNPFLQKVDNPFLKPPTPNINIDDILTGKAPDRDPVMRARFANATGDAITDDMVADIQDGLEAEMDKIEARTINTQKRDVEFNEEFNKKFAGVIGMMEEQEEFREKVGLKRRGDMDKAIKKATKDLSKFLEEQIDRKYELKRAILKQQRDKELRRIKKEIDANKGNVSLQKRTVEEELARVKGELAEMAGQPS